jgi:hypothetical protein
LCEPSYVLCAVCHNHSLFVAIIPRLLPGSTNFFKQSLAFAPMFVAASSEVVIHDFAFVVEVALLRVWRQAGV